MPVFVSEHLLRRFLTRAELARPRPPIGVFTVALEETGRRCADHTMLGSNPTCLRHGHGYFSPLPALPDTCTSTLLLSYSIIPPIGLGFVRHATNNRKVVSAGLTEGVHAQPRFGGSNTRPRCPGISPIHTGAYTQTHAAVFLRAPPAPIQAARPGFLKVQRCLVEGFHVRLHRKPRQQVKSSPQPDGNGQGLESTRLNEHGKGDCNTRIVGAGLAKCVRRWAS